MSLSQPIAQPVEAALAAVWPPQAWQEVTVVLAISGGADSVALLRATTALKTAGQGRLVVAHFNHHLRGAESLADEAFVADLCRQTGLECEVGHARPAQIPTGGEGLEAAVRTARYCFLQQAAARQGARYVATAHTADDQAETILHRVVRGTGIGGLRGMERARPLGPAATLIRPLLGVRRAELISYLDELGQPYRSDSSNADTRFTRNRIRHELLPRLARQFNAGVVDALLRLGTLAGELQEVIDDVVGNLAEQCVTLQSAETVELDAARLSAQPRYVVRELLMALWRKQGWPMRAMGFAQWDLLAAMISHAAANPLAPPDKQTLPGAVRAEAGQTRLRLDRPRDK